MTFELRIIDVAMMKVMQKVTIQLKRLFFLSKIKESKVKPQPIFLISFHPFINLLFSSPRVKGLTYLFSVKARQTEQKWAR